MCLPRTVRPCCPQDCTSGNSCDTAVGSRKYAEPSPNAATNRGHASCDTSSKRVFNNHAGRKNPQPGRRIPRYARGC